MIPHEVCRVADFGSFRTLLPFSWKGLQAEAKTPDVPPKSLHPQKKHRPKAKLIRNPRFFLEKPIKNHQNIETKHQKHENNSLVGRKKPALLPAPEEKKQQKPALAPPGHSSSPPCGLTAGPSGRAWRQAKTKSRGVEVLPDRLGRGKIQPFSMGFPWFL